MKLEIWSDVFCPWTYIGKRRLETALARYERRDQVDVVWRSFELRPGNSATPGRTLAEMAVHEWGMQHSQWAALVARIKREGAAEGLEINLDTAKPTNSFDAHRLVHLASRHALADRVKERLLRAYQTENRNIADHETLTELARDAGLDAREASAVLASNAFAGDVAADQQRGRQLGVEGSPTFVFDEHVLPAGAHPAETLLAQFGRDRV